jgi:hypothetical protein
MKKANEGPFISETHKISRRLSVFDDDGTCAYLYIYRPDSDEEIVADVFVYNRIPAPSFKEAKAVIPDQPPAPIGHASKTALCKIPGDHNWTLLWSQNGHSVALCKDGYPLAFIRSAKKPGYSRGLKKIGHWGKVWSEKIYDQTFGEV